MHSDQLVSVVIPAYNAEITIDETLRSVRGQTHALLEIIVVDDGSTDTTLALAKAHAAIDPRVQVIHQSNGGVAAARNTGWQQSRSDIISFIDADDLWAETKIERQLQVLEGAGPRAGMAYTFTAEIDSRGVVCGLIGGQLHEGDILSTILRGNFIVCGSNGLFRRNALIDAEGFDIGLRAEGYEGCEDWLLYIRIAETYDIVGVAEYLVGYRKTNNSMSSHSQRMFGSHILACRQTVARRPDLTRVALIGLRNYCTWLVRYEIYKRNPMQAWSIYRMMWNESRDVACQMLLRSFLLAPLLLVRSCFPRTKVRTGSEPALLLGRVFLVTPPLRDS
jgi:glycosyltransferase involved in cell wall biosynthesis